MYLSKTFKENLEEYTALYWRTPTVFERVALWFLSGKRHGHK